MTKEQLEQVEKQLDMKYPGWQVARGGIMMSGEQHGIEPVAICTKTPPPDNLPGVAVIEFDFDNIKIV
jgi:hypothetical protein